MSYAIDGQQYIGLAAGKVLYTFALPEETSEAKPAISRESQRSSRPTLVRSRSCWELKSEAGEQRCHLSSRESSCGPRFHVGWTPEN